MDGLNVNTDSRSGGLLDDEEFCSVWIEYLARVAEIDGEDELMYNLEVGGWPKWIIRLMKIFRKAK